MMRAIPRYEAHHIDGAGAVLQDELAEHAVRQDHDIPFAWCWDTYAQWHRHQALTLDMLGCIDAPLPRRAAP